jgi:hypothetical protein
MPVSKLLMTAIVVGIVVNIFDFLIHGIVLQGALYSKLPLMRTDASIPLLIVIDFVAAVVFVWVYQRVRPAFPPGAAGGALFGLYAGALVNFPTWIACYLLLNGFTYGLAWAWILTGIVWAVLAGAVTGAMSSRSAPTPAVT